MATALVIQGDVIGNDGAGQLVQAVLVPSIDTESVTYTTSVASAQFAAATRVVSIGTDGTKAFIKFGKGGVSAGADSGTFDYWQPANSVVTYVIDRRFVDRVAVYDGSS